MQESSHCVSVGTIGLSDFLSVFIVTVAVARPVSLKFFPLTWELKASGVDSHRNGPFP